MGQDISTTVRELCLGFPETQEVLSHGSPDFKVAGKTFATYCINHHGDGRVALWLHAPAGSQELYTQMEPEYYFVPPYVGSRGWLGVELNKGLEWSTIARRVREAYEKVAPKRLHGLIKATVEIAPPECEMSPEEINPFLGACGQDVLAGLQALCEVLPETSTGSSFGNLVWRAGKKTFVCTHCYHGRLCLQFWVGAEQQLMLSYDERYSIPAYTGHNGWIELDVHDDADWREIENLLVTSYRHFALKRMLKAMGEA